LSEKLQLNQELTLERAVNLARQRVKQLSNNKNSFEAMPRQLPQAMK
jgi:hypothetical protein